MEHKNLVGRYIVLTEPARWRNAGEDEARILPAGTMCRIDSIRPEGCMAWIPDALEEFFIFRKYIESAIIWEEGREMVVRIHCGTPAVCSVCNADMSYWVPRYFHIDAGGGVEILCADDAAILLGESSRGIIWEQRETSPADAVAGYFNN